MTTCVLKTLVPPLVRAQQEAARAEDVSKDTESHESTKYYNRREGHAKNLANLSVSEGARCFIFRLWK